MVYPGGPALLLLFRNNNAGTYYAVVGVGATSSYIACVFNESDDIIVITISKANAVITASLNSTAVSANSENHVTYNTSFTVTALLNGNSSTNLSIKYTGINGTSYAESTDKPINAGTYNVTIILADHINYYDDDSFSFTLFIDPVDISSATGNIDPQTYSGSVITLTNSQITITVNGTTLTDFDFTIMSYTDNDKVGTASVTVNGIGNYTGTLNIEFDISAKTYTVTFKDYDDSVIDSQTVAYGSSATAPTKPSRDGYTTNWDKDFSNITEDTIVTATYTPIKYAITYNLSGGVISGDNPTEYTIESSTITLINPTRAGYEFIGWTGTNLNTNTLTVSINSGSTGNREYTANWKVKEYTITYNLDGGSINGTNPSKYTITSSTITLINPTKEGYTFIGWTGTGLASETLNVTIPTGSLDNRTYTANWKINQYTITFDTGNGTSIDPITLDYNSVITAPTDPTLDGYIFNGWSPSLPATMPANDITVTAIWVSADSIIVRFYDQDGTTLLKSEVAGSDLTVTAPEYSLQGLDIYRYKVTWVNISDGTTIESFDNLTNSIDCKVVLVNRVYTVNVYYIDRDNVATKAGYAFTTNINNIGLSLTFGSELDLTRQVKIVIASKTQYFYLSTETMFNWNLLAFNDNENIKLTLINDNLDIIVNCVQAMGIVHTGTFTNETNTNVTDSTYYSTVSEAFEACQNVTTTTYLRIYGIARWNSPTGNCYLPDDTEKTLTIAKYSATINGTTYNYPAYTINVDGYTLETSTNSFTASSNLHIVMPYGRYDGSSGSVGYVLQPEGEVNYSGSNIQSILNIPNGFELKIYGSLTVGGYVDNYGTVKARAIIMNNGTITLENGAILHAYGYIKGENGLIEAKSGTTVDDIFRIHDWPGGKNGYGLNDKKVFPFNSFSFRNVSCQLKINSGAIYKSWAIVGASGDWVLAQYITLLGSGGLFEFSDSNGYLIKEAEDTTKVTNMNTSYTSSNQDITQRDVMNLYGSFSDNSITVSASASGLSMPISTGTDYPMPLGFTRIIIWEGTATLDTISYKFLPGSSLEIKENAKVVIGTNAKVTFYETYHFDYSYQDSSEGAPRTGFNNEFSYAYDHIDWFNSSRSDIGAQLIIDGELIVNGKLGGKILSNGTGKVTITTNYSDIPKLSSVVYGGGLLGLVSEAKTVSESIPATGRMKVNGTSQYAQFANGITYYYYNGHWGTPITISYNTNCDIPLSNVTVNGGSSGVLLNDIYLPTTLEKAGYTFWGWYLDSSFTTPANNSIIITNTTLYAKWELEYSITYEDKYYLDFASGNTSINDSRNPSVFSESTNTRLYDAYNNSYVFGGWFLDFNCTIQIENLTGSDVLSYVQNNNLTIYALWYPEDMDTYVIYYSNSNTDVTCTAFKQFVVIDGKFVCPTFEDLSDNNDDPTYGKYFEGWYLDGTKVSTLTISNFIKNNETQLYECTLTAMWTDKIHVNVIISDNNGGYKVNDTYYCLGDATYLVGSLTTISLTEGYELVGWTVTDAENISKNYMLGETMTISGDCTMTAIQYKVVTVTLKANQYSTVTLTITNGYYIESGSVVLTNNKAFTSANSTNTIELLQYSNYTVTFENYNNGTGTTCTVGSDTIESGYEGTIGTNATLTISAAGAEQSSGGGGCFAEGTLINMADGTMKKVEDLVYGDKVLVFNHDIGKIEISEIIFNAHKDESKAIKDVLNLYFSNGNSLRIVAHHGLFNCTLNKYVEISIDNVHNYIGHEFYYVSLNNGEYIDEKVTLSNYVVTNEFIKVYSPITFNQINCFAEGMLTAPGLYNRLMNIFELDENMKVDETKKQEDIELYGLYDYSMFEEYVSYEIYEAFNGQNFKVAIAKGIITFDEIIQIIVDFNIKDSTGLN